MVSSLTLSDEIGCYVTLKVLEIVRVAKADDIETIKRTQALNAKPAEPVARALLPGDAPAAVSAEPVGAARTAPAVDIRDRALAQLDRRW